MSGHESANPMVTDVFVKGAVQGWNIAVTSTIPNVLMAFVIIKVLNHSGLLTIFGELFAPPPPPPCWDRSKAPRPHNWTWA